MSKKNNLTDFLTDVADAIREKKGTSEKINPQDFSDEIRNLPSGGEVAVLAPDMISGTDGIAQIRSVVIKDGTTSLNYRALVGLQNLASIYLPDSVSMIGIQAFQGCISLKSIILPASLSNLQNMVFYGCTALELVDCRKVREIPTLGSVVFHGYPSNMKIVVPDALYESWISATNWASYADKIVKSSEYTD
jgi:hypothetical protein